MDGRWASRRLFVAAVLVGALSSAAPAVAQDDVPDAASLRFRAIVVDTSRLAELGSPRTADAVKHEVAREAREIFADRMAPGDARAPQLVIRIDSIQLAAYADGSSLVQDGSNSTDYLEGAGLVTVGGRVLSTTPLLSALNASYSGAWYQTDIDERRVASISHQFAYWLRRQMGL